MVAGIWPAPAEAGLFGGRAKSHLRVGPKGTIPYVKVSVKNATTPEARRALTSKIGARDFIPAGLLVVYPTERPPVMLEVDPSVRAGAKYEVNAPLVGTWLGLEYQVQLAESNLSLLLAPSTEWIAGDFQTIMAQIHSQPPAFGNGLSLIQTVTDAASEEELRAKVATAVRSSSITRDKTGLAQAVLRDPAREITWSERAGVFWRAGDDAAAFHAAGPGSLPQISLTAPWSGAPFVVQTTAGDELELTGGVTN